MEHRHRDGGAVARVGLGCNRGQVAPGPRRDVVLANAGAAVWVAGEAAEWAEGVERARASLDGGRAARVLEALVEATRRAGEAAA